MRGFIDDMGKTAAGEGSWKSQSAFVRGFIDDTVSIDENRDAHGSQSAFVRGFIDDVYRDMRAMVVRVVSIRVRARLHR